MLTNQDRRAILEQVKTSGSGDIMAALQGQPVLPQQEQVQEQQVQQEPASIPPSNPSPVNNVSMETPPVGQDSLVNSFSNTSPQIQDLPTGSAEPQLLQTGGFLKMITNPIRKRIAENVDPYSYEKPLERLTDAVIFNKKDPTRLDYKDDSMYWANSPALESTTERMDLLNMTMSQPQKYNSIEKAIYKPTKAKNPDAEYYRSIVTENKIKQLIKDDNLNPGYGYAGGVLGEFKIQEGEDEKGKYYSYYDKWDLNPFDHKYGNKKINKLVDKITRAAGITPPEIYGRVYLNDLETEQTVGQKITQKNIKEYRQNIKRQKKEYLNKYGVEAPKGYFSTNPDYDEKRSGGFQDGGLKNDEKKEKPINYRQHMMNYLHTSGRDTNMVNTVMNAIAQHESLNVDDKKQVSQRDDGTFYDGPGRGAYQFEMSDKGAASTALNRNYRFHLFNTDKELKDFPEINKLAKEKNPDLSTTSRANQDGIFIGDKIFGGPPRRNMFDLVTRNRTTSPNQEEVFQYWLKNHKSRISAVRNGKETTVPINEATKKEIAAERKKWNQSTKDIFKTGGAFTEENDPNLKVRKLVVKKTKKPSHKTELELKADTISNAFNNYTNPTLINNKNLNLQAALGVNPNIGWNPNNKSFSKYGTPNLNLEGSFGLSGQYVKNNFSANAGVNFQTGNKPTYKAGIKYNFKSGGYKKKCKYGCW